MQTIAITLRADDAEPILRSHAERAARYGAYCDFITRGCLRWPSGRGRSLDEHKKDWREEFLKSKRMVEAFGVDYEPTSEPETLTVDYRYIGGKVKVVDLGFELGKVGMRTGSVPDYKHPLPAWSGGIHEEACRQAAERVVRRWRAGLAGA
jgi:hypothetical protein